jgi:rhodanese-related sulfurtransferase
LLDVRTVPEFSAGHIPGALNIPVDELRQRLSELPSQRRIVAYCQVGQRGYLATRILLQHGYEALNLSGGFTTYRLFHPANPPGP